ncbi:MAG: helix-turn-helix domain-containing protein [Beijerinckiaceae bacterium]|nr:helix-turn-helix domain-containing protein [Beijerinckiaceae bacterium]
MDPRETLVRIDHDSGHGRWSLFRRRPPAWLAPYVRSLEGYVEEGGRTIVRKELPFGGIPMILIFGPGFFLRDASEPDRRRALDRSFIAGLHERPTLVGSYGAALCMQVNFTPQGAWRFCDVNMSEISGQVVDLGGIVGALAGRIEERLGGERDWPSRFALLEEFLWERLSRGRAGNPLAVEAWRRLEEKGGGIAVSGLAKSLDCSRKHLAHLFRREIGLTPKAAARILRFERAVLGLQAGRLRTLAELAASCGYADQAHFNRDFAAFAGECPTALIEKTLADGTGVMEEPG